jgi:hypothetical protein
LLYGVLTPYPCISGVVDIIRLKARQNLPYGLREVNMAKRLIAFGADYGHGEITGLFISTEEEVTAAIGSNVSFGEIAGKHSDVNITLKPEHFRVIEVSDDTIDDLETIMGNTVSGYNPFDYMDTMPDEYDQDEQISLMR